MHLFQILLPRADNSGRPFAKEAFDAVKEELAEAYDGVTAYLRAPAEGLWKQGVEVSHDDVVIFEVMAAELDLGDWRERRRALEERFKQDEIVIRYTQIELV